MSVNIVIADAHESTRQTLRHILEAEPNVEIAGEARQGMELIRLVEQLLPDIVMMDITQPVMNGFEATRRLRQSHPEVKVIGLLPQAADADILGMLRAGASSCVLKPLSVTELRKALWVVLKNQYYISPSFHGILINRILKTESMQGRMDSMNS